MKHVVFASDSNFINQLSIAIHSFCKTQNSNDYTLHIIQKGFSEQDKNNLLLITQKYNYDLFFYSAPQLSNNICVNGDRSIATFFRLKLCSILPDNIDNILYVDSDVIFLDDISPIFETNLNSYLIAGVQDIVSQNYKRRLGLSENSIYVNAGVLLINLNAWRLSSIEKKFFYCLNNRDNNLLYNDQDIINIVCNAHVINLPIEYNYLREFSEFSPSKLERIYGVKKCYFNQSKGNNRRPPVIVHFAGNDYNRPWTSLCDNEYKQLYLNLAMEIGIELNVKVVNPNISLKISHIAHKYSCWLMIYFFRKLEEILGRY